MTDAIRSLLQSRLSVGAGRVVGGQVPTAPSARPSARPGPKPFEQQELFPVRRVTDVSDEAIDTYAADEDDGDGGYSGTGYPITGAKPLDLTVTPFVRGTDLPEDVPGSIPPGVNTAYAGQLIEQAFGFGGYKYNSLTGRVERDDLKTISMALPGTIGFAAGIGSALSKKNLERIARKADAQEEGFALGMLQGRIVGVSPAPVGSGYVLSGVLPQNLTDQQRRTVAEQLLGISQRSRAEFAKEQEERQRRIDESQATQQETDAGAGLFQPGDKPAQPDPRYNPPPPVTYTTDPGDRDDSAPAGNQYSLDNYGSSYSATDFSFEDARMGRAKGGSVQRTGFVEGSPDNYTKGDTVADTVKTKVRENSFVLNAPTVERLQEAGMLPKGVDNSDKNATIKANKGGLMDVALSKGEYVIEPEEAQRIGYSFLEKINDQGKPEVDRRQAAADGGFVDGYAAGDMVLPVSSPVRQAMAEDEQVVEKQLDLDGAYQRIKNKFNSVKKANKEIDKTIDELPAPDVLAFMMIQEASVLGREGMRASGHVAMNRVHSNYKDFAKITDLKAMAKAKTRQGGYQFNVFNISDYRKGLKALTQTEYGRKAYQEARDLAENIFYGMDEDNTRGALFFRNPATSTDRDFQSKVENAKYIPTLIVRGQKSTQEYYRPIELMDAEDTRYIY